MHVSELPPQEFRRYFEDARRVGKLADATGHARVENPACGDVLEVSVRLGPDARVEAARFRCHGCSSSIAAAAAACDLAEGRTLAEARALDAAAIDAAVGGLAPGRRHGADLAQEALARALDDHVRRHGAGGAR
jgi:NifU-like protein involved in Fe-S cluster formation